MRKALLTLALVALVWPAGPVVQAGDHVVALRIASLDAMLAEGDRFAEVMGETGSRKQMLAGVLASMGISDAEWLDGSRPIVIGVPPEGLATMGWVGAIPVTDAAAALEGLAGQLEEHEVTEGVHSYVTAFQTPIHVIPHDGYLVVGSTNAMASTVDPKQLLDMGDLPPGTVALDIDLVPMTPMIQLGLAMGRQTLQQSANDEEADPAESRMMLAVMDLYLDLVNNTMLNTSRVQLSVEVGAESVLLHKRLLPREGSTLAGLLRAQKGEFPEIARRLDAGSAAGTMAASIAITPEFRAAMKAFVRRYLEVMQGVAAVMPEEQAGMWNAMFEPFEENVDQWVDCFRGDMAASYRFGGESGFRVAQLIGFTDGKTCGGLLDEMAASLTEMAVRVDGEPLIEVAEKALIHGGVNATRFAMDLDASVPFQDGEDDDSLEFMKRMVGGDEYVYYVGVAGDLLLSTVGADSEQAFKDTVDRLGTKSKRSGLTPQMFAPIETGPGMFIAIELGRLFRELAALDPDQADLQKMSEIPEDAGRFVMGALARKNSLDFDLSFPFDFFRIIQALEAQDEADCEAQGGPDCEAQEEPEGGMAPDAADRS